MTRKYWQKLVCSLGLLGILVCVPLATDNPYYLQIMIMIFTASIGSLGVRQIMATGQWSFGQSSFMAIGSYTSALLVMRLGFPFLLALVISGMAAALAGAIIGYPALRVKGTYFAILTLALVQMVTQLIILFPDLTGGKPGLRDIPPPNVFGIVLWQPWANYYLALLLFVATFVTMYALDTSRFGSVFRVIKQNDLLAQSVGINIVGYRVLAFTVACFFTGLAGSFSAHYYGLAHVDFYGVWQAVYLVAYAVVGGVGAVFGPVVGTVILIPLVEALRRFEEYQGMVYALVLIVVMRYLPEGLISVGPRVRTWIRERFSGRLKESAKQCRRTSANIH